MEKEQEEKSDINTNTLDSENPSDNKKSNTEVKSDNNEQEEKMFSELKILNFYPEKRKAA